MIFYRVARVSQLHLFENELPYTQTSSIFLGCITGRVWLTFGKQL